MFIGLAGLDYDLSASDLRHEKLSENKFINCFIMQHFVTNFCLLFVLFSISFNFKLNFTHDLVFEEVARLNLSICSLQYTQHGMGLCNKCTNVYLSFRQNQKISRHSGGDGKHFGTKYHRWRGSGQKWISWKFRRVKRRKKGLRTINQTSCTLFLPSLNRIDTFVLV